MGAFVIGILMLLIPFVVFLVWSTRTIGGWKTIFVVGGSIAATVYVVIAAFCMTFGMNWWWGQ